MNYSREISAFYDWLEANNLNAAAIALWYALINTAKRAGWPKQFTVSALLLMAKAGLSKSAFFRARDKLAQLGRIAYIQQGENLNAVYSLTYLTADIE